MFCQINTKRRVLFHSLYRNSIRFFGVFVELLTMWYKCRNTFLVLIKTLKDRAVFCFNLFGMHQASSTAYGPIHWFFKYLFYLFSQLIQTINWKLIVLFYIYQRSNLKRRTFGYVHTRQKRLNGINIRKIKFRFSFSFKCKTTLTYD